MNRLFHTLQVALAALLLGLSGVSVADESDSIVVLKTSQSLEQLVTEELQLERYIQQIATYNNIANVSVPLPVGSTLSVPRPYIRTTQYGRIAYVKGDVTHKQTDLVVNPPAKGTQVYQGDIIQTGPDGFISLTFKSGARVHVQPESRVVVKNIDCLTDDSNCVISLTATEGQVGSEVTPRGDGQPPVQFSIDTPFLTAAVRGTAFYVDVDEGENKIGVTKGLVATQSGEQANDLPKGKGLSVAQGVEP
ncbi:MAG: FecR domain-containing protein, partial [Pseudomonadota bacterium]